MTITNNKSFYGLSDYHRSELIRIEEDILNNPLDTEIYFIKVFKKFNIEVLVYKNKTNKKDDGVDFVLKNNNITYICQLKYWEKSLTRKVIKEIYGDMFLSDIAIKSRENKENIKYLLISPFISYDCFKLVKNYSLQNYYLITNEKFIELITNPKYFIENNLYER